MHLTVAIVILFIYGISGGDVELSDVSDVDINSGEVWHSKLPKRPPFFNEESPEVEEESLEFDLSIVWYMGLSGVIIFILLLCLEWLCRKCLPNRQTQASNISCSPTTISETPPPAYHHFAPPPYDSLKFSRCGCEKDTEDNTASIIWYITAFGALIAFFLIISCSEWCCRKHVREQQARTNTISSLPPRISDTPPPSYDLFAPPPYDSLNNTRRASEKSQYDVFVVPLHAIENLGENNNARCEDPPSYFTVSGTSESQPRQLQTGN